MNSLLRLGTRTRQQLQAYVVSLGVNDLYSTEAFQLLKGNTDNIPILNTRIIKLSSGYPANTFYVSDGAGGTEPFRTVDGEIFEVSD